MAQLRLNFPGSGTALNTAKDINTRHTAFLDFDQCLDGFGSKHPDDCEMDKEVKNIEHVAPRTLLLRDEQQLPSVSYILSISFLAKCLLLTLC